MEEPTRYNVTVNNSSSTVNGTSSPGGTDIMVDAFAEMYSYPALKPFVLACCAYHVSGVGGHELCCINSTLAYVACMRRV